VNFELFYLGSQFCAHYSEFYDVSVGTSVWQFFLNMLEFFRD